MQLTSYTPSVHSQITPQAGRIKLVLTPGWEDLISLFSSVLATDDPEQFLPVLQELEDQFLLLDRIDKERVRELVSAVGLSDVLVFVRPFYSGSSGTSHGRPAVAGSLAIYSSETGKGYAHAAEPGVDEAHASPDQEIAARGESEGSGLSHTSTESHPI